jgi:hypothetical protein
LKCMKCAPTRQRLYHYTTLSKMLYENAHQRQLGVWMVQLPLSLYIEDISTHVQVNNTCVWYTWYYTLWSKMKLSHQKRWPRIN